MCFFPNSVANSLRRVMIAEVPTVGKEQAQTIIQEEKDTNTNL